MSQYTCLWRIADFQAKSTIRHTQAAKLAIRVHIEQCFFHCAKAFLRSQLWKPETWTPHKIVSFGTQFAAKTGASNDVAKQIDEAIERDYRENL